MTQGCAVKDDSSQVCLRELSELRDTNKRLLEVLWRIAASDPNHKHFATLVMAEVREAIEFAEDSSLL
jgi:hypothetical protein